MQIIFPHEKLLLTTLFLVCFPLHDWIIGLVSRHMSSGNVADHDVPCPRDWPSVASWSHAMFMWLAISGLSVTCHVHVTGHQWPLGHVPCPCYWPSVASRSRAMSKWLAISGLSVTCHIHVTLVTCHVHVTGHQWPLGHMPCPYDRPSVASRSRAMSTWLAISGLSITCEGVFFAKPLHGIFKDIFLPNVCLHLRKVILKKHILLFP